MAAIPLLKVRYAEAFVDALDRLGAPSGSLLRHCNLNEDLIRVREGLMPVSQLWDFAASSTLTEGLWELGFEAGSTPLDHQSDFGRSLLFAPTLFQAMQQFCAAATSEYSEAAFHVRRRNGLAWFCAGTETMGTREAIRQVEMYRYGMMIQIIRWAAGPGWLPVRLELQSEDDGRIRDIPQIRSVDARFGKPMLAIGMPIALLSRSLDYAEDPQTIKIESGPVVSAIDTEFNYERAIREVIRTHVLAHRCQIGDAAHALGVSVRSLQRRLAQNNLTYSQLLEQARTEIAQTLLVDTNWKLSDVSRELGYRHATHFSRAFKRVCGVSPIEYRISRQ